ncbi:MULTISPECIES: ribonuclease Z [unclassified Enterococcus]|uniref:ribonuclease Z n=1 Tax=unclassified Enterococcus TaxID=2608891 RepID=UPI0015528744|nr:MULTISPECIES: ribonuclease Z [unclassified Enterococcus]MBS7576167.1 ribonuclease Z [Enterococcus sp. MMGLQ5-2]MBS7583400.1 ribonuclease Z [Enterococcus sp. MMGLQ5-1]NPD11260.1 ribonuclease Z [Enterococcus sp. MMGLQ5-1]NPD36003.1 ribonuclease Z [Enterococcus sp. MMGLQ5-2]
MEIQFLGTGAGMPAKHRNVSSLVLKLLQERNEAWLFDCGEAAQIQILHTTIKPRKINKIFITHLHGDHIFGLPGLLSSRTFQAGEIQMPLTVYGPVGIQAFIEMALKISQTKLGYPIEFHELKAEGVIFEDSSFRVETAKLAHGIPCFGYRIIEKDKTGELQVDKLQALGVLSGPIYGKIKSGQSIEVDGKTYPASDFIGETKLGKIVTILGDTRRTEKSIALAKNADVLVHEATYGESDQKLAYRHFHSTSVDAAKIAQAAGVKQLLLNHISARFTIKGMYELEREAKQIFKQTKIVRDLEEVEIK